MTHASYKQSYWNQTIQTSSHLPGSEPVINWAGRLVHGETKGGTLTLCREENKKKMEKIGPSKILFIIIWCLMVWIYIDVT